MKCADCGEDVKEVYPVIRLVKNHPNAFTIEFVCKGCFVYYGRKSPPDVK